jgi:hypothetical protein
MHQCVSFYQSEYLTKKDLSELIIILQTIESKNKTVVFHNSVETVEFIEMDIVYFPQQKSKEK